MNFKRIEPSDMSEIWNYLLQESGRTCDFSYGGVLMWVDLYKYDYCIYDDTLFLKGILDRESELPVFSLPIGKLSLKESVALLQNYCKENNIQLRFSCIPEYAIEEFNSIGIGYIKLKEQENLGDYLYDANELATLSGKRFSKKRNHVNQFINNYNYVYERINADNFHHVKEFVINHCLKYSGESSAKIECGLSLNFLENLCKDNPLIGGLLKVDNQIVAFTIADIKGDTLYIHVEKADRNIKGAYEAINKIFAEDIVSQHKEIKYINREDDAGDEGLRKAKMSYNPVDILKKYDIIL